MDVKKISHLWTILLIAALYMELRSVYSGYEKTYFAKCQKTGQNGCFQYNVCKKIIRLLHPIRLRQVIIVKKMFNQKFKISEKKQKQCTNI